MIKPQHLTIEIQIKLKHSPSKWVRLNLHAHVCVCEFHLINMDAITNTGMKLAKGKAYLNN